MKIAPLAAALLLLAGCASAPVDRGVHTTVVLLPDEDGHVGKVSVSTKQGSQTIDQAYDYATVDRQNAQPTIPRSMGEEAVRANFHALISAQPTKPVTFIVYFALDSTELTEDSKAKLPQIFKVLLERKPTEVAIFGFTDAIGTEARNIRLSAARANAVQNILIRHDPDLGRVDVQYFGDKDPLFPTRPNTPEPRNRRAEIVIL
jgi:peptidoglycan-associated lipoprotein